MAFKIDAKSAVSGHVESTVEIGIRDTHACQPEQVGDISETQLRGECVDRPCGWRGVISASGVMESDAIPTLSMEFAKGHLRCLRTCRGGNVGVGCGRGIVGAIVLSGRSEVSCGCGDVQWIVFFQVVVIIGSKFLFLEATDMECIIFILRLHRSISSLTFGCFSSNLMILVVFDIRCFHFRLISIVSIISISLQGIRSCSSNHIFSFEFLFSFIVFLTVSPSIITSFFIIAIIIGIALFFTGATTLIATQIVSIAGHFPFLHGPIIEQDDIPPGVNVRQMIRPVTVKDITPTPTIAMTSPAKSTK
mmetsp:Transcript_27371/g.54752  ORF Transcript_27371/g.54752 Transcript_27371/m.54752 type:complete len:306 (-) Transcript_27371:453-1370(-)